MTDSRGFQQLSRKLGRKFSWRAMCRNKKTIQEGRLRKILNVLQQHLKMLKITLYPFFIDEPRIHFADRCLLIDHCQSHFRARYLLKNNMWHAAGKGVAICPTHFTVFSRMRLCMICLKVLQAQTMVKKLRNNARVEGLLARLFSPAH
eukprot:5319510-Amphidinium_carterae.3